MTRRISKPAAGEVLSRTRMEIRGAKRERDNEAKFGSRGLLGDGGVKGGATGIGTGSGRRSERRRRAWGHNWRRGWSRRRRCRCRCGDRRHHWRGDCIGSAAPAQRLLLGARRLLLSLSKRLLVTGAAGLLLVKISPNRTAVAIAGQGSTAKA